MENSQNKEADMRDLTNIYVNAIMANSDKLVNADALAQKAWNSFFYQREVYNAQSSYNKEQKKITGNKKRKQTDVDDIILESRFVQKYW